MALKNSLPFFDSLPPDDKVRSEIEFESTLRRAKDENMPIATVAGGTPVCCIDGKFSHGKGVTDRINGQKRVIEPGKGPSETEIESLELGMQLIKHLNQEGISNILGIPEFDTQGVPPKEREILRKLGSEELVRMFLPKKYEEIIGSNIDHVRILFSSGYSHATGELLKGAKRRLDSNLSNTETAEGKIAKFFYETTALMYNAYVKAAKSPFVHHVLLTTPLSRKEPRPEEEISLGLDIVDTLQVLGCILLTFEDKIHCGSVTAGRLSAIRRLLGKIFDQINKNTPIITVTFQDIVDDGMSGVNWMRGVDMLTTLSKVFDLHLLFLSQRGKIERSFSSQISKNAKDAYKDVLHGKIKTGIRESKIALPEDVHNVIENTEKSGELLYQHLREEIKEVTHTDRLKIVPQIGSTSLNLRGDPDDRNVRDKIEYAAARDRAAKAAEEEKTQLRDTVSGFTAEARATVNEIAKSTTATGQSKIRQLKKLILNLASEIKDSAEDKDKAMAERTSPPDRRKKRQVGKIPNGTDRRSGFKDRKDCESKSCTI
ncbi:MAG: hypothetical protein ABIH35_03610 [Patescibacteria group bacterium]